jgi:hypothetical protein
MRTPLRNTTPLVRGRAHSLSVLPAKDEEDRSLALHLRIEFRAVKGETWDCHGNKVRFLREQLVGF